MNENEIKSVVNESGTGLKIGVIGIGNAGSQVALAAAKRGINVFIMNTSLKDLDDSNIGLKGSPTKIAKASDKVRKGAGEQVTLDPEAGAAYLLEKLQEKHII